MFPCGFAGSHYVMVSRVVSRAVSRVVDDGSHEKCCCHCQRKTWFGMHARTGKEEDSPSFCAAMDGNERRR